MRSLEEVMVVSSLEGAMLDTKGNLAKANKEVVQLYCERGGHFTVASNRTPAYVAAMLKNIPVTDPVICCGGAVIYDVNRNEYVAQRMLHTEQAREMLEAVLVAFPQVGAIVQRQDGTLCVVQANQYTHTYMQQERSGYLLAQAEDVQAPWVRVIFTGKTDQMDRLEQYAERHKHGDKIALVRASDDCCHLLAANVSKGNAVRELAQICEIPQQYIYSIGGNHSDQALLQMTGHAVAVPSAPVRVKLAADLVTRLEACEGGAAEFLYCLTKEYEK